MINSQLDDAFYNNLLELEIKELETNSIIKDIHDANKVNNLIKLGTKNSITSTNNPYVFNKQFSNYILFINCESFKNNELSILHSKYNNNGYMHTIPVYEYSKKNKDVLIIQTSFNDFIKSKFVYKLQQNSNQLHIEISSDLFERQTLDILIDFDNKMREFIKNTHDNFKCIGKIVHNKGMPYTDNVNKMDEISMIKTKFIKDINYKQYNKVVNYNISKKFPKVEEFDLSKISPLDLGKFFNRILNNQKEFRMMISPVGWINTNNSTYGSYLGIIMLEIKYKGTKIISLVDSNEVITKQEIINLTI